LQKSIRRRRPLPAVRVAMELADKSWSDLIRRVPIIILEDAIIHNDFPLLVWLMVADSKEFTPCVSLVVRVMQIIFEVASCPWKDIVTSTSCKQQTLGNLQLTSDNISLSPDKKNNELLLLRSMLLRKQYGGMAGDMEMLNDYVDTWRRRFTENSVDKDITNRLFPRRAKINETIQWIDIPSLLYDPIRLQNSSKLVPPMLIMTGDKRVTALKVSDITLAGIDFHCCNVLESVLSDEVICSTICNKLRDSGFPDMPATGDKKKLQDYALIFLKKCMCQFSSGVSNKRLISGADMPEKEEWFHLWQVVIPSVNAYSNRYLAARLVH